MEQSCFETIDSYHLIDYQIKQENLEFPFINLTMQANPILPDGKYLQSKSNIKYSYQFKKNLERRKNKKKSLLPSILENNPTITSNFVNQKNTNRFNESSQLMQIGSLRHEFFEYIQPLKLVYQRLNNSQLNSIGKMGDQYYSSIFIDVKQIKAKKNTDFYEMLKKKVSCTSFNCENEQLKFDSNFQSGNLFAVYKVQYYIIFRLEILSMIYSFKMIQIQKDQLNGFISQFRTRKKLKLNLILLISYYKESSLYQEGMKPLVYSRERFKTHKQQWKRGGYSIQYYQFDTTSNQSFYQLSFNYQFEFNDDKVYFAYTYPYTHEDLRNYLNNILQIPNYKKIMKKEVICKTILNKQIQLFSISQNIHTKLRIDDQKKQIIYVIARQHSGESPGSFILEGFMNTILANRIESIELRKKFIFKIVPMMNIDGVICGNYRSNLSGFDINRKWNLPSKHLHPQIYHLKQKIMEDKKSIKFFIDLHGHSRKMNSFFYGNSSDHDDIKLFPFICSKLNKYISKEDSSYTYDPSKKSTARLIFQNQIFVRKSYTFEASFYGYEHKGKKQHFTKNDYRDLGSSLVLGLFYSEIKFRQKFNQLATDLNSFNNSQEHFFKKQSSNIQKQIKNQNDQNGIDCSTILNKTFYESNTAQREAKSIIHHNIFHTTYRSNNISRNTKKRKYQEHQKSTHKEIISNTKSVIMSRGLKYIETFTNVTFEKWLKQIKKNQVVINDDQSVGSDSDPEIYQLSLNEIEAMTKFYEQSIKQIIKNEQKLIKVQQNGPQSTQLKQQTQEISSIKQQKQTKSLSKTQRSNLKTSKQKLPKQKLAISEIKKIQKPRHKINKIKESKIIQFSTQSNLKDQILIKHLEHQMQIYKKLQRVDSPSKSKKESPTELRIQGEKNFSHNILELKRTLKFLIDRKEKSEIKTCLENSFNPYKQSFQIYYQPPLPSITNTNRNQIKLEKVNEIKKT